MSRYMKENPKIVPNQELGKGMSYEWPWVMRGDGVDSRSEKRREAGLRAPSVEGEQSHAKSEMPSSIWRGRWE